MRTTPLISPPSCTSSRFAAMSPCTTLVDWISIRSSARIEPRTSPPIIASREITSPSTSPPLPTSPCRPARTVPTTVPSIFTTPSALMSPTTRMPVPMMDSPDSDSSPPCPFSVNIAMSILLSHDREGIERLALAADFEVEVRRRGSPRVAGERDHLPRLHRVAFAHQQARGVPIHRFIPARVPHEHEQSVRRVGARRLDRPAAGGTDRRAGGHGDIDARMRLGDIAGPHLPAGDEPCDIERPVRRLRRARLVAQGSRRRAGVYGDGPPEVSGRGRRSLLPRPPQTQHPAHLLAVRLGPVQRRRELLHPAVLLLQPRHLTLEAGHAGRRATDRSREGEEQHDQQTHDERAPLPALERPQGNAVLAGSEVSLGVGADGEAARFSLLYSFDGAPRVPSTGPAQSSFG